MNADLVRTCGSSLFACFAIALCGCPRATTPPPMDALDNGNDAAGTDDTVSTADSLVDDASDVTTSADALERDGPPNCLERWQQRNPDVVAVLGVQRCFPDGRCQRGWAPTCQFQLCCDGVVDPVTCECQCNSGPQCSGAESWCCEAGPGEERQPFPDVRICRTEGICTGSRRRPVRDP